VACEEVQVRYWNIYSLAADLLTNYTRINEFNVEDVLALFLPYHESPHFAKMLSILHIKCVLIHTFVMHVLTSTFLQASIPLFLPPALQISSETYSPNLSSIVNDTRHRSSTICLFPTSQRTSGRLLASHIARV
jgi:hypothetical protein